LDIILESKTHRIPVAVGIDTVYVGQVAARVSDVQRIACALRVTIEGRLWSAQVVRRGDRITVWADGRRWEAAIRALPNYAAGLTGADSGRILALMPGSILQVHVRAGDTVRAGQPLVTMESMKMQMSLDAQIDGVISVVHVEPGVTVDKGAILVDFERQDAQS
jgi:acetyl/propionyl-CoA carboxylase alpha subunit